MKFPAYPRTKPSGVEWLGDVPEHWGVKRLRHVLSRNDGGVWGEEDDPEGTVVLRSTEQTVNGGWQIADPARRNLTPKEKSAALLKAGDLVVTKSSGSALHIGKTSLVSEEVEALQACYSNFMQRLRVAPGFDPRLVFYVLNSPTGRQQLVFNSNTTTGLANLNAGVLGDVFISTPPPAEQRAIAAFLDRETGRVDRLVAKKRELIERLKEKRTALISRTVTRGLPPAAARAAGLPANPPLKPSVLDWLGEIPAHWSLDRHSRHFRSWMGQMILREDLIDDGEVPVYSATESGAIFGYINDPAVELVAGDIVIPARGVSIGFPLLVKSRSTCTQTTIYSKLMNPERVHSPYVFYWMVGFRDVLFYYDRTAIPQITVEQVSSNPLLLPPLPEQTAIAAYLDLETAKLDALVGKVEAAVERLQEYRTALITAAVTGKIDVRKEVAA